MPDLLYRGPVTPSFDIQRPGFWRLVQPPVYRYLPKLYVDSFFETGQIMLSSYRRFAEHKDEARGDTEEGNGVMVSLTGADRTFGAYIVPNQDAYVMCCSYILSNSIMEKFDGCETAIEITDVHNFALAVANKIPGFTTGTSGHCIYRDKRIIYRQINGDPTSGMTEDNLDMNRVLEASYDAHQGEHYFFKRRKFSYQAEYRLIWQVDENVSENLILSVPNARQFCRRVEPVEIV